MSPQGPTQQGLETRPVATAFPEFAAAAAAPQPPPLLQLNLRRALQLHGRLAIGFAIAGLLLAAAFMVMQKPKYSGTAVLYVQPAPPRILPSGPGSSWPFDSYSYEQHIQQQLKAITRYDVLKGALAKVSNTGWQLPSESEQAAIDRLENSLEVDRVGTSYQISVIAHAGKAEQAAALANAVSESFIESVQRQERAGDTDRLKMLRDESDRVKNELTADRTEQEVLNKKLGVASITPSAPNPYDDRIAALRTELVHARAAHDEAASHLVSMQKGGVAAEADTTANTDSGLSSLKTSLNQRRSVLISQMANLTASHPQYKQDAAELAQIDASLDSMTNKLETKAASNIQEKLSVELQTSAGTEARLNGELAQATAEAGGSIQILQRSQEVATDIQRLEQRFATVDEQLRNQTLEDAAPIGVHLAAAAVAPMRQDKTKAFRMALVTVIAFCLMGLAAAVLRHRLDPRLYTAEDVEQFIGFPPMAILPDSNEVSEGVNEEFLLRLTASIEGSRHAAGIHRYVFTAPTSGTGVSLTVTRIKAMLDAMGKRAVLIDASSSRPTVVPAGVVAHGNPQPLSELSVALTESSSRPTEVLRAIDHFGADPGTGQRDIVLTDAAPLPLSAEAEYLVRFSDATVVVLESGRTTRQELGQIIQTLKKLKVRNVGFLLNRVSLAKADPAFVTNITSLEERLRNTVWHAVDEVRAPVSQRPATPPAAQRKVTPEPVFAEEPELELKPKPEPERRIVEPVTPAYEPIDFSEAVPIFAPTHLSSREAAAEVEQAVVENVPAVKEVAPEKVKVEPKAVKLAEPVVKRVEPVVVKNEPVVKRVEPVVVKIEPVVARVEKAPAVEMAEAFVVTPLESEWEMAAFGAESAVLRAMPEVRETPRETVAPVMESVANDYPPESEPPHDLTDQAVVDTEPADLVFDPFVPTRITMPTAFQGFAYPTPRWDDFVSPPEGQFEANGSKWSGAEPEMPVEPSATYKEPLIPQPRPQFRENMEPPEPLPSEREMYPYMNQVFDKPAAARVESSAPAPVEPVPPPAPRPVFAVKTVFPPEKPKPSEERPPVVAVAEILPPDFGPDRNSKRTKRSLKDDDEDMQILPSWRGQYRRQKP